jgi:hypothetical protein
MSTYLARLKTVLAENAPTKVIAKTDKRVEIYEFPEISAPPSFYDHRCDVCGQRARFGYGVRLLHAQEGQWYCAAHRPGTA